MVAICRAQVGGKCVPPNLAVAEKVGPGLRVLLCPLPGTEKMGLIIERALKWEHSSGGADQGVEFVFNPGRLAAPGLRVVWLLVWAGNQRTDSPRPPELGKGLQTEPRENLPWAHDCRLLSNKQKY